MCERSDLSTLLGGRGALQVSLEDIPSSAVYSVYMSGWRTHQQLNRQLYTSFRVTP